MSLAPCAPRLRPFGRLALLASVVLTAVPTHAQNYKADPVDQGLRKKRQQAKKYAESGVGDRQLFEDYLTKYFFPSMTQPTPNGLAGLAKANKDLFDAFLLPAKSDVQKYVHEQSLEFAVRVVMERRYHPAVRNNALLILGKLQDDYATGAPCVKANDLLCKIADSGAKQARLQAYLLSGALLGIDRHTQAFSLLPSPSKTKTARALHSVMSTDALPMHVGPGVSDWLYLRTAKAIGNLGTPARGGIFAIAIANKASDENLSIETRAAIAAELDRMNLAPGRVKADVVTKAVFDLAAAIGESESEIATKFEDMQLGGRRRVASSGRGNEARRFRESDKNQGEMVLVREGIIDLLLDLSKAVQAASKVAGDDAKTRLTAIDEAVNDAIQAASNKDLIDLNVADAINSMASAIEANAPVPPAEEEEADVIEAAAAPANTK